MATPTQTRFPLRATLRTVLQAGLPLVVAAPQIYTAATQHDPAQATGWAASILIAAGILARVMAVPVVNDALGKIGLSAAPLAPSDPLGPPTTPPGQVPD
jgi:hypothetical protein